MPLYISALKSFGDFVIALSSVGRVQPQPEHPQPIVVAGRHLNALAVALGVAARIRFIGDETWTDVPAAFDIGRRGKVSAIRSMLVLRRWLSALDRGSALVFDQIGWRERFIGGSHQRIGLPRASDNIYLAYDSLLIGLGYEVAAKETAPNWPVQRAVIIPGARLAHKIMPTTVIAAIDAELRGRGIQATVITLDGETLEVPPGVCSMVLPRRFDALVATVKATDMVISADSLSAHLGEYHGLPTFVATPVPNQYWLPQLAYLSKGWATFDDLHPLRLWLNRCSDAL